MPSNIQEYKNELKRLIDKGDLLYITLILDLGVADKDLKQQYEGLRLLSFERDYESWYSIAMQVVKQILPDRLNDFVGCYKNERRKEINAANYSISDYIIGLSVTRGLQTLADGNSALPKLQQQINILRSADARLESRLVDMTEIVQADLFDDELDAARELTKKGFLRGAGAIAGVILEKHLGNVCMKHEVKIRKKRPTIDDLNQKLKDQEVIDMPTWRSIQYLGDLRNLCDHNQEREPKKEELADLLDGVSKIMKTVF